MAPKASPDLDISEERHGRLAGHGEEETEVRERWAQARSERRSIPIIPYLPTNSIGADIRRARDLPYQYSRV